MRLSLRASIFLGMVVVPVVFIVLTVSAIYTYVGRVANERITENLLQGRTAYTEFRELRHSLIAGEARALAQTPHLRAVLGIDDVDYGTLHFTAQGLLETSRTDLLLLLDWKGHLLADAASSEHPGVDVSTAPLVAPALEGEEQHGFWVYREQLYSIAVSPIIVADQVLGAIVLGEALDARTLRDIREFTGRQALLIDDESITFNPTDADSALNSETEAAFLRQQIGARVNPIGESDPPFRAGLAGRESFAMIVPLPGTSCHVVLFQAVEELTAPFDALRLVVLTAGLVALVVLIFFGLSLGVRVRRTVRDRERAEQALRHTEEQLRRSQKLESLGTLAGGVAHDFNNLLTIILGYGDKLASALVGNDDLHDSAEAIVTAGQRAEGLTRQLLAFGRRQPRQPRVVDFNDLVSEMEKMLRRLVPESIEITLDLGPAAGHVKIDPGQLEQVLVNLATNARDAMTQGGTLSIETTAVNLDEDYVGRHMVGIEPGRYTLLSVSDTGCGMDSETQDRVFEPFFTTKEQGKGTGLGLAMVYGIVKQSGGNTWVYSELGIGTTVKVYLPIATPALVAEEPPKRKIESSRPRETVLLVEDEEALRGLIRDTLEHEGYKVLEAELPKVALEICDSYKGPIHLLLTDVVMPQMSGRQVVEHVTKSRQETKTLYMSGYTADIISYHGLLDEDTVLLQKPFSPQGLVRKVRETLDVSSALISTDDLRDQRARSAE